MPLLDLQKLTVGLSRVWAGYLRDWDRSLRSGNYPETTRYNYLLAAAQLGRYLGEYSPDPDADDGLEGVGEARPVNREEAVAAYLEAIAHRYVVGSDPFNIENLVLRITRDADGTVTRLHWATYLMTRDPLAFGQEPEG